jgi:hypothetical protein
MSAQRKPPGRHRTEGTAKRWVDREDMVNDIAIGFVVAMAVFGFIGMFWYLLGGRL